MPESAPAPTAPAPLPPAKVDRFREGVDRVIREAAAVTIASEEDLDLAGQHLRRNRELQKLIHDFIEPFREMAHAHKEAVLERRRELLGPLTESEEITKGRISEWVQQEEDRRLAERQRLYEDGKSAAEARREAAAQEAEAHGEAARADQIRRAPVAVTPDDLEGPPPDPRVASPDGIQIRRKWKAAFAGDREASLRELLQAIIDGKPGASLNLIGINWTEADKLADGMKEHLIDLGIGLQGTCRRDVAVR